VAGAAHALDAREPPLDDPGGRADRRMCGRTDEQAGGIYDAMRFAMRAICDSVIPQPIEFGIIWRQFSNNRAKDCSNKRNGNSSDCCSLFMMFVVIIGGAVIDGDDVFFACFVFF
jgi:hypothetical protein